MLESAAAACSRCAVVLAQLLRTKSFAGSHASKERMSKCRGIGKRPVKHWTRWENGAFARMCICAMPLAQSSDRCASTMARRLGRRAIHGKGDHHETSVVGQGFRPEQQAPARIVSPLSRCFRCRYRIPARGSRAAFAPAGGCSPLAKRGTDYVNGLAPDVVQADRPLNGESQYKRESRRLYRNVKEVLVEVGAGFPDVVRVDQYYTTERAMHPYHEVRHEVFGKHIPPSTSNLHQRFSRTGQTIEVQVMAAVPGAGPHGQARDLQAELRHFSGLGLQPRAQCRRFPLRAGTDRRSAQERRGTARSGSPSSALAVASMADQARNRFHHQAQAPGLARRRRRQSRQRGEGSGLSQRSRGRAGLQRGLAIAFQERPPATTIIATAQPGFAINDLRIEINTISLATKGKTRREVIRGPEPPAFDGYVSAVISAAICCSCPA